VPFIQDIPDALLTDLREGRRLPIIGAGFSRNARVDEGHPPMLWRDLGQDFARAVNLDPDDTPAIEAISTYEDTFGRPALIRKIADSIRAYDSKPGAAHIAFAGLSFDTVVTTNFDLLLEDGYAAVGKRVFPILDESQLATSHRRDIGPRLMKLHGDIHHPLRVVASEDDYDRFVSENPLMVAAMTGMLVSMTGVLIGYSLDDPDVRQILALIRQRLGRDRRPLWTIQFSGRATTARKYERRGVHVLNLPDLHGDTGKNLEALFGELIEYQHDGVTTGAESFSDEVAATLRVNGSRSRGRLCYFAIPARLVGWYQENIFPLVEERNLIPVTAREVISESALTAKIDTLIQSAAAVIAEPDGPNAAYELNLALASKPDAVLMISNGRNLPQQSRQYLVRPDGIGDEYDTFIQSVRSWLEETIPESEPLNEAESALAANLSGLAVVSAVGTIENALRQRVRHNGPRLASMRTLIEAASIEFDWTSEDVRELMDAVRLRNEVAHSRVDVRRADAKQVLELARRIITKLEM
jgi:hypothetical protein